MKEAAHRCSPRAIFPPCQRTRNTIPTARTQTSSLIYHHYYQDDNEDNGIENRQTDRQTDRLGAFSDLVDELGEVAHSGLAGVPPRQRLDRLGLDLDVSESILLGTRSKGHRGQEAQGGICGKAKHVVQAQRAVLLMGMQPASGSAPPARHDIKRTKRETAPSQAEEERHRPSLASRRATKEARGQSREYQAKQNNERGKSTRRSTHAQRTQTSSCTSTGAHLVHAVVLPGLRYQILLRNSYLPGHTEGRETAIVVVLFQPSRGGSHFLGRHETTSSRCCNFSRQLAFVPLSLSTLKKQTQSAPPGQRTSRRRTMPTLSIALVNVENTPPARRRTQK